MMRWKVSRSPNEKLETNLHALRHRKKLWIFKEVFRKFEAATRHKFTSRAANDAYCLVL